MEAMTSALPGMPMADTKPLDSKEKLVSPMTPVEPEDSVSFVKGGASYTKGNNGSSVSTFKPEGSGTGDGNKKKQDRDEKKDQKETTKSPENRKKGVPPKGNRGPGRGSGNQPGSETNGPGHNAAHRAEVSQSKSRLTAGSSTAKGPPRHLPAVKEPSNGAQTQTNNTPRHNAARRGSGVQCERAAAGSHSKGKLTADGSAAKGPSGHTPAAKRLAKVLKEGTAHK